MKVYRSNLQIFYMGGVLEKNVAKTSTLTIEEIDYTKVDAWEVIAEFVDEENQEKIICGAYKSYEPDLDFYMVVYKGDPNTFKDKKDMYDFLEERGYVFNGD